MNWLSPMNRIVLVRAFKAKTGKVTLVDGRVFRIKYSTTRSKALNEEYEVAYIEPIDGSFVPCGYFNLDKVMEDEWIFESDKKEPSPSFYVTYLEQFLKSDTEGICVTDEWPDLKSRTKDTLYRGFSNAKMVKGKTATGITIMTHKNDVTQETNVFLIKTGGDLDVS
jgi:hypothetical protein